jgi:hypothetical protein
VARSAPAQEVVREVLAKWLRAAQKDPSCVRPIAQFLYLLGDDDADRARLLDIIWTLRNDPDEPLAGDIASKASREIWLSRSRSTFSAPS